MYLENIHEYVKHYLVLNSCLWVKIMVTNWLISSILYLTIQSFWSANKKSVSVDFHREILKHIFEKRTLLNECKKTCNSDAIHIWFHKTWHFHRISLVPISHEMNVSLLWGCSNFAVSFRISSPVYFHICLWLIEHKRITSRSQCFTH